MAESPPKAQAGATQNNPGVNLHAGNAGPWRGAPADTRETFTHTQRLPEHGSARLQLREIRALAKREEKIHGSAHRGANGVAMPTDEDDQDGHFFYNHPERGAYPAA